MKKRSCKVLIACACLCLILFGFAAPARAQLIDYGGYTTIFFPCTAMPTWFLVYHIPAGTPIVVLMYSTAKQPQDDDDPNHLIPSFGLLGLVAPVTIPCLVYAGVTVITIGVGFPVII
jgi:hypothetical protein